jgi:hypothetical protein
LRRVRRSEFRKPIVLFDQPLVAGAQPCHVAFKLRQRYDRRTETANAADCRRDCGLGNGKEGACDRRDGASGAGTLRTDLKQREQPCDDDDADQREKFSFVSIREDDRS